MLRDAHGFEHIYIACGRTDLRKGIDGLIYLVQSEFGLNPLQPGSIFLFCGVRRDRIKALVYEGDGFCLLYKRLADGHFRWPRTSDEVCELTYEQYQNLMNGFEVIRKQTINMVTPQIL